MRKINYVGVITNLISGHVPKPQEENGTDRKADI